MTTNLIKKIACPNCKLDIPVDKNEVTWCHHCDWNVDPYVSDKVVTPFEKFLDSLGKKISEGIYRSILKRDKIYPKWTIEKIITVGICFFVIMLPAALLILSFFGFSIFAKLFAYLFFIVAIGFVYISYSNWMKEPKNLISRTEYPLLYDLVDRICWDVGKYKVEALGLNSEFNAFYTEMGFGFFKKRYISLGLPLIEVLADDELIALIAHEAAHGANKDLLRSWLMHRSQYILSELFYMFAPRHSREGAYVEDGMYIIVVISNYLFRIISEIPLLCWKAMRKLYMRDSQEAEYYADLVATSVCGKDGMVGMLEKLTYIDDFDFAVGKLAIEKSNYHFFDELKKMTLTKKSQRSIDRLKRLEKKRGLGMDSTHPPTNYRISVIKEKGSPFPKISLNSAEFLNLKKEWEKDKARTVAELLDARLKILYDVT